MLGGGGGNGRAMSKRGIEKSNAGFTPEEVRAADSAAEALVGEEEVVPATAATATVATVATAATAAATTAATAAATAATAATAHGGEEEEKEEKEEQASNAPAATSEYASLDKLYEQKAFADLHDALQQEIAARGGMASAPVALLWRFCRVAGELEDMGGKGSKELIFKALDATAVMLSRESSDREAAFHGNKWAGILLGQAGNYKSTADQVRDSRKIKEHITRALSYDASDSACHYTLGRWHYAIADLPSSVRAGLSWIFSIPPASFQEAYESFAAARRGLGDQPWHSNTLWMAKSAIKCGGGGGGGSATATRALLEEVVAAAGEGGEEMAAVGEETVKEAKALLKGM